VRLGSQAEVAGDVPADLFAPVVGDLGQPLASLLQAGAAFDVGISELPISPQAIFAAMRYRPNRVGKVRNRPRAD
jgi:hypothetical protein